MNRKLRSRLQWLWNNRTTPLGAEPSQLDAYRYIPRAFDGGGPGWGVYDRLAERYLEDDEVIATPMDRLQHATHLS
jgi:hypothetical protein